MSCSMPTMDTDSRGVITSFCLRCRLLLLCRLGSSSDPQSSLLDAALDGLWNSVQGEATSSIGVGGLGVPGALPRRVWISFHTLVRCPKDGISSSLKSSNFRVIRIAPEMSLSSNLSTIDGSNPASYIHLATCCGVHEATSFKFSSSTASVNELRGR